MLNRVLIFLSLCIAISAFAWYSRADAVDDLVRQQMSKSRIPGIAIAVVKDGKVIKSAGFGVADAQTLAPVSPDTVFRIASITKQFTATGIMMLVERPTRGSISNRTPTRCRRI
jgi:CubicO group peptidase (beta-lactamase class C family)